MPDREYPKRTSDLISQLERNDISDDQYEQLAHWSSAHPDWLVRCACLRLLAERYLAHPGTTELISAGTHDPVDWVAFTSIKLTQKYKISSAIADLIKISGWPSNFTQPLYARKPVGLGAAFTKRALLGIFGTSDPIELRRLEDSHFAELRSQVSNQTYRRNDDVVLVPAGPFISGGKAHPSNPFQINDTDSPLRLVELPAFYMDRLTVTNSRYREFLADIGGSNYFDHPDHPAKRDHFPAHSVDPRFNDPGYPVVGINWYDAWAFANWSGGQLPSEEQWEKAARGTDGRVYPWGNEFDARLANYVERSFECTVGGLADLEDVLLTANECDSPPQPVLPAESFGAGASPYGALQMAGNVWEMTRTNFFSRSDMDPFFKLRNPAEFMSRRDAFHVLRGGSWSSPEICLTTYYRGRDLITDQHCEVGFRCVYPVEAR